MAFYIILFARLISAFYSPIHDCDEVFNYWEPSHYLNHGYGRQTWEYSPVYAIRSWTYAGIHSTIIALARLLLFIRSKSAEFYFLRIVFAIICALCETRMYSTVTRVLNPRVALIFLIIMVTSTGMFHASVAYLPSSFAMYTTMFGATAFMDWKGGLRTAQGIMCFGIGAILGWPFAGALVIPFLVEEITMAVVTQEGVDTVRRFIDGTVRCLIVLVPSPRLLEVQQALILLPRLCNSSLTCSSTDESRSCRTTSSSTTSSTVQGKAQISMAQSHGIFTYVTSP